MKTITTTAIVALMTATIGLSAAAPSFAQDATAPTANPAQAQMPHTGKSFGGNFRHNEQGPRHGGPGAMGEMGEMGGPGALLDFRNAEAIEIALVRLSHRIELTTEQQPLFDAFKTAAVKAATDFTTAAEALRPAAPAAGDTAAATPAPRPDFAERLTNRIAMEKAQLAALEAVQPSATAFFGSLTDEQKVALAPERGDHGGPGQFGKGGPRHQGHNQVGAPGADAPPEAPVTRAVREARGWVMIAAIVLSVMPWGEPGHPRLCARFYRR